MCRFTKDSLREFVVSNRSSDSGKYALARGSFSSLYAVNIKCSKRGYFSRSDCFCRRIWSCKVQYLHSSFGMILLMFGRDTETVPTGFVVTGPNITSQGLLFNQLATHLKSEIDGPVVTLRSGDASNLKAVLKQLIRDATNQKLSMDDEEDLSSHKDVGR